MSTSALRLPPTPFTMTADCDSMLCTRKSTRSGVHQRKKKKELEKNSTSQGKSRTAKSDHIEPETRTLMFLFCLLQAHGKWPKEVDNFRKLFGAKLLKSAPLCQCSAVLLSSPKQAQAGARIASPRAVGPNVT